MAVFWFTKTVKNFDIWNVRLGLAILKLESLS